MERIIPVRLNDAKDKLVMLDQTLLPCEQATIELDNIEDIRNAIKQLRVRGAPAIGIAAGFALYLAMRQSGQRTPEGLRKDFIKARDDLAASRPTAVNLFWALDRMTRRFEKEAGKSPDEIRQALLEESESILKSDQETGKAIGMHGLNLLKPGMGLLTHCNAGGIATSGYGTALAPMYCGHEKGYGFRVFVDETRPLLQGSRLTAHELLKAGLDVTVICDNAAASVMKQGFIQAVLVGCDRIAANGDTANKIGTLGLAVLAREFGIPFYVLGPTSTIDIETPTGQDIPIELRDGAEITESFGRRTTPAGVKAYNPAFDVTDAGYITAIVTEKGVAYPPYDVHLAELF